MFVAPVDGDRRARRRLALDVLGRCCRLADGDLGVVAESRRQARAEEVRGHLHVADACGVDGVDALAGRHGAGAGRRARRRGSERRRSSTTAGWCPTATPAPGSSAPSNVGDDVVVGRVHGVAEGADPVDDGVDSRRAGGRLVGERRPLAGEAAGHPDDDERRTAPAGRSQPPSRGRVGSAVVHGGASMRRGSDEPPGITAERRIGTLRRRDPPGGRHGAVAVGGRRDGVLLVHHAPARGRARLRLAAARRVRRARLRRPRRRAARPTRTPCARRLLRPRGSPASPCSASRSRTQVGRGPRPARGARPAQRHASRR